MSAFVTVDSNTYLIMNIWMMILLRYSNSLMRKLNTVITMILTTVTRYW